jgi:hypothetical protein
MGLVKHIDYNGRLLTYEIWRTCSKEAKAKIKSYEGGLPLNTCKPSEYMFDMLLIGECMVFRQEDQKQPMSYSGMKERTSRANARYRGKKFIALYFPSEDAWEITRIK